ncbi:hypothetical protein FRC01_014125, partial [Tulasnella sp. 417]
PTPSPQIVLAPSTEDASGSYKITGDTMDPLPDHPNLPRIGPHHIPDDVIIYLLDFLDSTAIATMALATRHLQALVTPTLYRTITIPGKEGNHIRSAAILLRTLSKRPSLTALVRHLENAPPLIPPLVLESVWLENTPPSNSLAAFAGQGGYAQSWSHSLPVEVMKSCVNLQTLTVCGTITSYMIAEADKWLNFLLDPKIKLKSLKLLVNPTNGMIRNIWNNFIAQILDVQSSLEYLDYPFDDKYPVEKERTESWAPKLRMLCGNDVCGFKALLSPKRSIETLVVRSIPVTDIRRCFGAQLNEASTVEEFVYQGPKVGSTNFADLFEMVPSLKIFRGETWLSAMNPLEDLFWE